MAKPVLVDIDHGVQSWDADINDNNAILRDAPAPIYELNDTIAALEALHPAASFDRCIAWINDPTDGWVLVGSNGTAWQRHLGRETPVVSTLGAHGQRTGLKTAETTLTLTGASVTAAALVPAGSILLGITTRVTTAITGAGGFTGSDIGDGTTQNLYGTNTAPTLNFTTGLANHAAAAVPKLGIAAGDVVFTAVGGNFTAGVVRIEAHYISLTPPTS